MLSAQIKSVVVGFHELLVTVPASPGDLMAQVGPHCSVVKTDFTDSDLVHTLSFPRLNASHRLASTFLCLPALPGCWNHLTVQHPRLQPHFPDPRLPWPEDNQLLLKFHFFGKPLSMFAIHRKLKKLYLYLMQILQIRLHIQDTQLLYRNFIAEIHILVKKALGGKTACLELPIGDLNICICQLSFDPK